MTNETDTGAAASTMDDLVPRPYPYVRIRNLSGVIVLGLGDDTVELSEIAEVIWRAMAPGVNVLGVARVVAEQFGEDEAVVIDDVREFLAELSERGFIALRSPNERLMPSPGDRA